VLDAQAPSNPAPRAIRALPALRIVWPWLLIALVAVFGWRELRQVDFLQVLNLLRATDATVVALLIAATALNLALAGFYDVAALGARDLAPPPAQRWKVGVIAFAWTNFLTVGPLAGPALRLWMYGPLGVSTARARRALLTILAAFTTGLGFWCAAVLVPLPEILAGPVARFVVAAALGVGVALSAARVNALWGDETAGTRRTTAIALAAIGVVDWLLAWIVFHVAVASQVEGELIAAEFGVQRPVTVQEVLPITAELTVADVMTQLLAAGNTGLVLELAGDRSLAFA
jgi:uncharacterized membrane protein YbhN (UPF0104 family)